MTLTKVGPKLVKEMRGGEPYEYYPLGEYIVIAPGVCGGRPTFKGSRLEVRVILNLLAADWSVTRLLQGYGHLGLTAEAVAEAVHLAEQALREQTEALAA